MPNIRLEVLIAAPAAKVFDAISTKESLSSWWTPETRATAAIGTVARLNFGDDYFKEMRVTRLTPVTEVAWECIAGVDEWVGTTLRFELDEGEKEHIEKTHPEIADQLGQQGAFARSTVLAFSHDSWRKETPMFAECNYTWGRFLRGLKTYCETGKGLPWPKQHGLSPEKSAP